MVYGNPLLMLLMIFFYEHHHNGVFGPGGYGWSTFKSGNLALLIAILTTIGFILYIILN